MRPPSKPTDEKSACVVERARSQVLTMFGLNNACTEDHEMTSGGT